MRRRIAVAECFVEERMYEETFAAEDGHWWFLNLRNILGESIRRHVRKSQGLRILDAGCGTGRNLLFYADHGRVAGVDFSRFGLEYCRRRGLSDLAMGDVCRLPFRGATFDIVNSSDVLYAIDPGRAIELLQESLRVLKPGGVLFLNTAAMDIMSSDHDRAVRTRKRYRRRELAALVEESGFELLKVRYWNSILFFPVLLYRIARKALNAGKSDTGGDLKMPGPWVNRLLYRIIRLDWALAGALPFGTSLFCAARKPRR
jgi:SAM-dependent methyltransferase